MDTCQNLTLFVKDGIQHTEEMYIKYLIEHNFFDLNAINAIKNLNSKVLHAINPLSWEKVLKQYSIIENKSKFSDTYYTFEPITHKCLSNMQEHKLSDCPSLKGMVGVSLD